MPSVRRLDTQEDCRRALAHLYRLLERDEIDVVKAKALCYLAMSISAVLRDHALEARLAELESRLKGPV